MEQSTSGKLPSFCEIALSVPLDKTYTYGLSEALCEGVQTGCRVVVQFGARTLTGVVLSTHSKKPAFEVRPIQQLLDDEAVLSPELIDLGRWISSYYCTPIGIVLKSMLPLGDEMRSRKTVSLTPAGVEAADRFKSTGQVQDPAVSLLLALRRRPLSWVHLLRKQENSAQYLRRLQQRGLIAVKEKQAMRDPTQSRDGILTVSAIANESSAGRKTKGEKWLLGFLRANPGFHDLRSLLVERKDVVSVARKLAREGLVELTVVRKQQQLNVQVGEINLNPDQQSALEAIRKGIEKDRFQTFLLHGVTGSGKTEVYLRATEETVRRGRSALLMVPEIGLTPASASRFFNCFGENIAILHSGMSGMQRAEQWRRIRSGQAQVVLGTRSSVFAPLSNLGLVIVDEEHDNGYKQDEAPRYHGRNVAIVRARNAGAVVVLGSATPSLESRRNTETGKYTLLSLPARIHARPLPSVSLIDMRQEFAKTGKSSLFSGELVDAVQGCINRDEQAMILLNRRGFSRFLLCRSCGNRIECNNCSVALTYHKNGQRLLCHYCDHEEPVPSRCPDCEREFLQFQGTGTQKVEDALNESFPQARIARLDRDSVRGRHDYVSILQAFREGEYNLLVGTQMIAKGHDIPNVTLVGVVDADIGLGVPDFRAAERTFQLLTQVAGRAGRGSKPGLVLLQTVNPDHYAIELVKDQDYQAFYEREVQFRKMLWYPPFTVMASMIVRSRVLSEAVSLSQELSASLHPLPKGLRILGPAEAPMVKLRTEYRYQFLMKSQEHKAIAELLTKARKYALEKEWPATALVIDVDPVNLT